MERAFFGLFAKHKEVLYLDVGYLRSCDWTITVCDMRDRDAVDGSGFVVCVQSCDRQLVFAKAYAALAEWYSIEFGGY